jgi:flagellar basal-body rod modification protein FlgD
MDPTAMVGQMISLNQLDQLISINQELGVATGGANATNAVS